MSQRAIELAKDGVSRYIVPIHIVKLGVSTSGKSTDFDSVMRRFESFHPCHLHLEHL
jgi:hypothetical protein